MSEVLLLQRAAGNRAVSSALASSGEAALPLSAQGFAGNQAAVDPARRWHERQPAPRAPKVMVQRMIQVGKTQDVDERVRQAVQSLVEGTPFSRRDLVEGEHSSWHLHVKLTNASTGPSGQTYVSTQHPNLVRIAITLAQHRPKKKGDRNDLMGQLFATFLHEWEVHGVNRVTAGRPPSEVDSFVEHYALGKGEIKSIPRLLASNQLVPGLGEHGLDIAEIRAIARKDHERDVLEHSQPDVSDLLWPNRTAKEAWKETARAHRWEIESALQGTAFDDGWTSDFLFPDDDLDDVWEGYLEDLVEWAEEGMPGTWEGSEDRAPMSAIKAWLDNLDKFMNKAVGALAGDATASTSTQGAKPGLEKIYDGYVAHLRAMNTRGRRAARQFVSQGALTVALAAPTGDPSSTASPLRGWALGNGSTLPNLGSLGQLGTES